MRWHSDSHSHLRQRQDVDAEGALFVAGFPIDSEWTYTDTEYRAQENAAPVSANGDQSMATRKRRRTSPPSVARSLSPADTKKLLGLIKNSKSIELKTSVPMPEHRGSIKRLGLDPVEAQPRQVYFFDTPDQALNRAGLIVRARRRQGGRADTVVKLRPVDPALVDAELKASEDFKVEVDAMPDGTFVCSASYKGAATGKQVLDVADGKTPLRSLFSRDQLDFYDAHAPSGIDFNSLLVQGPIFLLRAKHQPKDFPRGVTVEMWLWPDGKHILEISTKCLTSEAFQVGTEFKAFLGDIGIDLGAPQETKTRTAMQKFKAKRKSPRRASKQVDAAPPPP
jgi:hypothetical protein